VAASENKKPIMDVAKPGKTMPTPTSRPIITNHGSSIIKDPVVKQTTDTTSTNEDAPKDESPRPLKTTGKTVQPLAGKEAESKKVDTPSNAKKLSEDTTDDSAKQDELVISDSNASDAAIVDAVAEQAGSGKRQKQEDAAEAKRREELEKLIAEKKYILPIKQQSARGSGSKISTLVLVVLVALVGAYCLIDAGVVNAGFKMPFHIFKQKDATTAAPEVTPAPVVAPVQTPEPTVTEYTSQELGLSFSYPKAWGDVLVSTTIAKNESGKRALLTFSKEPKVMVGMKSKAWTIAAPDVDQMCKTVGFIKDPVMTTDLGNGRKVISITGNKRVVEQMEGGLCGDIALSGYVPFSKNTTYAGAEISYRDKVTDKFDLAQRIADYQKNETKYFPTTLQRQIIDVTNSVTEK
jgi:hypothetical protein